MNFEHFVKFVNECGFLFDEVDLVGSGEPFLHPECLRFIKYLTETKHKKIACCSNGTVMTDFEGIVKSGLHTISIDIDGVTQSQHEKYRRGSDLNKVLSNITKLVQAKKTLRSRFPKIYFDTLISKYNENNYNDFIILAKKAKVNGIQFRINLDDMYKTEDWFPIQKKFRPIPNLSGMSGMYNCYFKNSIIGILSWDGEAQLCCMSPNNPEPLIKLNVFETDNLLHALDSQEFYDLTKSVGKYEFCKTCSLRRYSFYSKFIKFGSFPGCNTLKSLRYPIILLKNILKEYRRKDKSL